MATSTSIYKTNFHKYDDCVRDIAKREVYRVFTWLYIGGTAYVGDYLQLNNLMCKMQNHEKKQLRERKLPEELDIPFLYHLIQYTCGLTDAQDKIWNDPEASDLKSLEHSLYLIREMRNELSHEDMQLKKMSNSELTEKMEKVCRLCCIILDKAGQKCHRLQEAAIAISETEDDIHQLMGLTPDLLASLGKQERQKGVEEIKYDWYVQPILHHKGNVLPLSDILGARIREEDRSSVIIIKGDAGTGKTSLWEYMDWLWLKDQDDVLELQDYDMLLPIDCQRVCTYDLVRLLWQDILPNTMRWCSPYEVLNLLDQLYVLWIIDSLEFSTPAATDLIANLMKTQNSKHTFMILSRPEHTYPITSNMNPNEYAEISIHGINPFDIFQRLNSSSQNSEHSALDVQSFVAAFENLNPFVKFELQNPLKLHLAMQFWKMPLEKLNVSSLTEFYEAITTDQIESLAGKLQKGNLTKDDALRRVRDWFDFLCKIAFEITVSNNVREINNIQLEMLKRECDRLQFSSADNCLSSFLTHVGPGKYSFLHSSQMYCYAALHGACIFQKSENFSEVLELFGIIQADTDRRFPAHYYEVLLHMVSLLQASISRSKAEDIVCLLGYSIHGEFANLQWFNVVKSGCYKKEFLIPISKKIPDKWLVSDQYVKAAKLLLEYVEPSYVVIQFIENPSSCADLKDFIRKLSDSDLPKEVAMYFYFHLRNLSSNDTSDELLELVCQEDSACRISAFAGHLSKDGLKLLLFNNIRDHCHILELRLKSPECLSPLCYHSQYFLVIEVINLTFSFLHNRFVSVPVTLPSDCFVDLHLPYVNDSQAEKTAKLISSLTKNYTRLFVAKLSHHGASKFVSFLQQKGVYVKELIRNMSNQTDAQVHNVAISYGPIPLPYPISIFEDMWVRSEKLQIKVRVQVQNV